MIVKNEISAGTFHWLDVAYGKGSSIVESRPVLIIEVNVNDVYYYYLTTREGLPHQHKYRPRINDWQQSGLNRPSYVYLENPIKQTLLNDFQIHSFIGYISNRDKDRVSEYMIGLGY